MLIYSTEVSVNQSQLQRIVNSPLLRRLIANVSVCLVMAFRPMPSSTSMFFIVLKILAICAFLCIVKYKDLTLKEETHTAKRY